MADGMGDMMEDMSLPVKKGGKLWLWIIIGVGALITMTVVGWVVWAFFLTPSISDFNVNVPSGMEQLQIPQVPGAPTSLPSVPGMPTVPTMPPIPTQPGAVPPIPTQPGAVPPVQPGAAPAPAPVPGQ